MISKRLAVLALLLLALTGLVAGCDTGATANPTATPIMNNVPSAGTPNEEAPSPVSTSTSDSSAPEGVGTAQPPLGTPGAGVTATVVVTSTATATMK